MEPRQVIEYTGSYIEGKDIVQFLKTNVSQQKQWLYEWQQGLVNP